jgi:hypothetical protein
MSVKTFSTVEVAKKLKIGQANFQRLIRTGRIDAPPVQSLGNVKVRLWTAADIRQVKKQIEGNK